MEINLAVVVVAIVAVEENLEVAWIEAVGVEAAVGDLVVDRAVRDRLRPPMLRMNLTFQALESKLHQQLHRKVKPFPRSWPCTVKSLDLHSLSIDVFYRIYHFHHKSCLNLLRD